MDIWQQQCEQLLFLQDRAIGLKAIIAIHNTKLGPALGGCRMRHYASDEEAIRDALRLAAGMTYKSALSGIPYGGGKAVVISHPGEGSRETLFQALGQYIEGLHGEYITGMDLGTTVADMDIIRRKTSFVTDTTGSLGAVNDLTARMTAYGVFIGIQASLKRCFGSESLHLKTVAVQGLGKVGYQLCRYLKHAGARLIVADIDTRLVKQASLEFGAKPCPANHILSAPCDVLAPCALGGILNDASIPQLNCRIVAGAANNQLEEQRHGELLQAQGILYAPDYVINAGGIIVTAAELDGGDAAAAQRNVETIYGNLMHVFHAADSRKLSSAAAADWLAEQLLGP